MATVVSPPCKGATSITPGIARGIGSQRSTGDFGVCFCREPGKNHDKIGGDEVEDPAASLSTWNKAKNYQGVDEHEEDLPEP